MYDDAFDGNTLNLVVSPSHNAWLPILAIVGVNGCPIIIDVICDVAEQEPLTTVSV